MGSIMYEIFIRYNDGREVVEELYKSNKQPAINDGFLFINTQETPVEILAISTTRIYSFLVTQKGIN